MKMKTLLKLTALVGLLAYAVPARAAKFWNVEVYSSSGSLHIGWADNTGSLRPGLNADRVFTSSGAAVVQSTSTTAGYKPFRVLNAAAAEIWSITQSGIVTAATFVGNLTGNVTGNVTGTATSLAANGANCSAGNYPLGVDASGAVEGCTTAGVGDSIKANTETFSGQKTFSQPILGAAMPWRGINYLWQSSSGTVIYSTGSSTNGGMVGTTTGVDSFHIAESTFVINGVFYHTNDTLFSIPRSTYVIAWVNTSGVISTAGIVNMAISSISSYTATIGDGVVVGIASTSANGDVHLFQTVNELPQPSIFYSSIGNGGVVSNPNTTNGGAPSPIYNCASTYISGCFSNAMEQLIVNPRMGSLMAPFSSDGNNTVQLAFVVNNFGSGSQNVTLYNLGAGFTNCISIDGAAHTCNTTVQQTVSVGTGRHSLFITRVQGTGTDGSFMWQLPPNMKIVRPGYW